MSKIFCPRCGTENDATAQFCVNCAEPLGGLAGSPDISTGEQIPWQPPNEQPYGQPVAQPGQQPVGQPVGQQYTQASYDQPYGQPQGQPTYAQPPYGQPQGQPAYAQPPYGQQPTNAPVKKSKTTKIVIGIIAGLIVLCGALFFAIFGIASCSTNAIAEADYYEIGGDRVPSVKQALGKKYEVTGFAAEKKDGLDKQDIEFKTDGASNEEMNLYASYLSSQGWLYVSDYDYSQTVVADPGYQMATNSAQSGYMVIVTIRYEAGSFNLVIDRGEGDLSLYQEPPAEITEEATEGLSSDASDTGGGINDSSGATGGLMTQSYLDLFASKNYHMLVQVYSYDDPEGTFSELYVRDPYVAMSYEYEGEVVRVIIRDGKEYIISDTEQMMIVSDSLDTVDDFTMSGNADLTFVGSGNDGQFYGGTYYYEAFESYDGSTELYFFDKGTGDFMGVRTIWAEDDVMDMVFFELDQKVPDDVFAIPSNYEVVPG